jgi:hypothetical protein
MDLKTLITIVVILILLGILFYLRTKRQDGTPEESGVRLPEEDELPVSEEAEDVEEVEEEGRE